MDKPFVLYFWRMVFISLGVTYVLVGSRIGHPIRFVWCWLLDKIYLSYFWSILLCPPCNAWWSGLAVATWFECTLEHSLFIAFTSCGIAAIVQGIALSVGLESTEDYKKLIPNREK